MTGTGGARLGTLVGCLDGSFAGCVDCGCRCEQAEASAMTTSPVLRLPCIPVDAGRFHPPGDEGITRRQELPPVGDDEIAQFRVPPAGLRVVDIEILRRRILLRNHPPILASSCW